MTNKEYQISFAKLMLPKLKFATDGRYPALTQLRLQNAISIIEELLKVMEVRSDD